MHKDAVVVCIYVHLCFLLKPLKSNQVWCSNGMEICKHIALCVKEKKSITGLMEDTQDGCLISNMPTSPGLPAGSSFRTSISHHYWQKQESQLIVASHTVGSINMSARQQHPIAHWDAPPYWPGISCFSVLDCKLEAMTATSWAGGRLSGRQRAV